MPSEEQQPTQEQGPYVPKHAEKWQRAENYGGQDLSEYYVGPSQSRDSEALERSNFKVALEMLGGEKEPEVIVGHFGHWLVGWMETILVREDASDKLRILDEIGDQLESYPALNDEALSQEEFEERERAFESMAKSDMVDTLIGEVGEDIVNFLKERDLLDRNLYRIMDNCSSYNGETMWPTTIADMKKYSEDIDDKLFLAALEGDMSKLEKMALENAEATNPAQTSFKEVAPEAFKEASVRKLAQDEQDEGWSDESAQRQSFEPEERLWVDHDDPDLGDKIQQNAKRWGWDGAIVEKDDEGYEDAITAAEEFMNTLVPHGFHFGTDDDGDWGMWEGDVEDVYGPHSPWEAMKAEQESKEFEEQEKAGTLPPIKDETGNEPEEEEIPEPSAEDLAKVGASKKTADYIKKRAQDDPPYSAPAGMRWVWKNNQWTLVSDSDAQKMSAARILAKTSIISEFADDVYPKVKGRIKVGSRVLVKSSKQFGEVIRVVAEGIYRVKAGSHTITAFEQELELRSKK